MDVYSRKSDKRHTFKKIWHATTLDRFQVEFVIFTAIVSSIEILNLKIY